VIRNIKMSFRNYSRSDAMGEIYDEHIYRHMLKNGKSPISMTDLLIQPNGQENQFHPYNKAFAFTNADRKHKVPILVLNASSLNTGHNWVFTAAKMGEVPPRDVDFRDLDKKDRYRRVRYEEIDTSKRPQDFPMGKAVAASAGVPGLFPPLPVSRLYKDRTVQLVDGGVFDNQGISSLLDPEHLCTDFIISDACGQSGSVDNPKPDTVGVLAQSSGIMMGRIREESVNSLVKQYGKDHVAYFHLKRGLYARDIEFNEKESTGEAGRYATAGIDSSKADYGVDEHMQQALSEIRTDLDSFSNPEARALQADAYLMCDKEIENLPSHYRVSAANSLDHKWAFRPFISMLKTNNEQLLARIKIGRSKFLKAYRLMKVVSLKKSLGLLGVSIPLAVCLIIYAAIAYWGLNTLWHNETFRSYTVADIIPWLGGILAWYLVYLVIEKFSDRLASYLQFLRSVTRFPVFLIEHLAIPVLLFIPIKLYINTVNPYYVKVMGEMDTDHKIDADLGHPGSGTIAPAGGG
ncbi:MAG: hypothetical protein PVJ39_18910, partial [Gammaproteobacteria bacterium]